MVKTEAVFLKMKVLDLFCGAGGFSTGFQMANYDVVAGIDFDPKMAQSYQENHKDSEFIEHDISGNILDFTVDIVIGSPPCQGFSDARGNRKTKTDKDRKRNFLVFDFIRWIGHLQPKIVLMENVAGMETISKKFMENLMKEFKRAGYIPIYEILDSKDFGIPQNRRRIFCLGIRKDLHMIPSLKIQSIKESSQEYATIGEAIGDLPRPTDEGNVEIDENYSTPYLEQLRSGKNVYNHTAMAPRKADRWFVERIGEGMTYRSSRFGERYVGVWDLCKELLKDEERDILISIAKLRTKKEIKTKKGKYEEGYVQARHLIDYYLTDEKVKQPLFTQSEHVRDILEALVKNKWLRKDEKLDAYDLNTRSGIRPMYTRLARDGQSRTIMTTSFSPRELIHPTENRGISLREGARIQSFTDDFRFYGKFKDIATQIGNAVPPLLSKGVAIHIKKLLDGEVTQKQAAISKFF